MEEIEEFRIKETFLGFAIQKKVNGAFADLNLHPYSDIGFAIYKDAEVHKNITHFNTLELARKYIYDNLDKSTKHPFEEGVKYHPYK